VYDSTHQQRNGENDMNATNATKKLVKAGFEITQTGNRYMAQKASSIISFVVQSESVICIKIRSQNDRDDSQSDYSAGVFCDNLTQAIKLAY
jgi:hypothetical protein